MRGFGPSSHGAPELIPRASLTAPGDACTHVTSRDYARAPSSATKPRFSAPTRRFRTLMKEGRAITFQGVHEIAGVSTAWLYPTGRAATHYGTPGSTFGTAPSPIYLSIGFLEDGNPGHSQTTSAAIRARKPRVTAPN